MFTQDRIAKLEGKAKNYLDKDDDLVALKSPDQEDYLSQYLRTRWAVEVSR
jgi:hypothetical protein